MTIFLDIDGVLIPAKSWQIPELESDGFPLFSSKSVNVLKNLISESTTIILTTSHKSRFSIQEWKDIFSKRGLKVNKLETLVENVNHLNRKNELLNWFNSNDLKDDFLIIDDDKSLNDLPTFLKEKLVLTSPYIGLSEKDMNDIKTILEKSPISA
jgi:hypothetical protein